MKNKTLYISVFLAAFIFTSGVIIYLNSVYSNIFKFDFSPRKSLFKSPVISNNPQGIQNDSLISTAPVTGDTSRDSAADSVRKADEKRRADSLYTAALKKFKDTSSAAVLPPVKTSAPADTIPKREQIKIKTKKETKAPENLKPDITPKNSAEKINEPERNNPEPVAETPATEDTLYSKWMKSTAKLYENMDPKKAAKIISTYSDNMARDIIYTMKKKKAAEVLAELNPEFASRITRMK